MNERSLFLELRDCENIAIFGAKNIAKNLVKRMKYLGILPDLIIVSNLADNDIGIDGIKVKELNEVKNIEKFTCIIATVELFHDEIEKSLYEKGVKKILKITSDINEEIIIKNKNVYFEKNEELIRNIETLQYGNNNLIKLQLLKEKIKNGQKVKVLFLVAETGKFACESLYKEMLKQNKLFDPQICLILTWQFGNKELGKLELQSSYRELKEKGYSIVVADKFEAIDEIGPDIIIYNMQYLSLGNSYIDLAKLNFNYLTCYIPYGIDTTCAPEYNFNNFNINTAWINFSPTPYLYELNVKFSRTHAMNAVSLGYPKLDNYITSQDIKLDERPIVIYAPHWSINKIHNYSNFEKYYDFFENLRINHPEYFWVFKPHPVLKYRLYEMEQNKEKSNISYNEFIKYCERWNNAENGMVFDGTNYIELFKNSECLITDCISFIAEYLPANKPCIYMFNSELQNQLDTYQPAIKEVFDTYYLCSTSEEIEDIFNKVIIKKMILSIKSVKTLFRKCSLI